jgi:hypothetical protein
MRQVLFSLLSVLFLFSICYAEDISSFEGFVKASEELRA